MLQSNKFQILMSFALWSDQVYDLEIIKQERVDLFLDSGAFSNWKQGKEIVKLDDYIHFVKENKNLVWNYINLDVIGNEEKSKYNFEIMKAAGLKPIPVFTKTNEPLKKRIQELLDLCNENEFIALGGIAGGLREDQNKRYLYDVYRIIKKHTRTKVHLLGTSSYEIAKDLRPYSMDSSTSSIYNAYGMIRCWDNKEKKMLTFQRKDTKERLITYRHVLRKYSLNAQYLLGDSFWASESHEQRAKINLYAHFLYQKFLLKNNIRYFQAVPLAYFIKFDDMVKHYAL